MPQTVYQTLMQKYEAERAQKAAMIPELEEKIRKQLANRNEMDHWAEIIHRYTEITDLDETILFELVDHIEVGESVRNGPLRFCDVKVYYRYAGNVDAAVKAEARHETAV